MALSLIGERPRPAAMLASPFAAFTRWIAQIQTTRLRRTALAALLDLDHARLDDLGIDRQDVLAAMAMKGLSANGRLNAARAEKARL